MRLRSAGPEVEDACREADEHCDRERSDAGCRTTGPDSQTGDDDYGRNNRNDRPRARDRFASHNDDLASGDTTLPSRPNHPGHPAPDAPGERCSSVTPAVLPAQSLANRTSEEEFGAEDSGNSAQ